MYGTLESDLHILSMRLATLVSVRKFGDWRLFEASLNRLGLFDTRGCAAAVVCRIGQWLGLWRPSHASRSGGVPSIAYHPSMFYL